MKTKRNSLSAVNARQNDVYEMLMQGKSKSFIVSYCNSNWGVRLSTVEHDIAAVREELNKEFQQQKADIIANHVAKYDALYAFYMDKGEGEDLNIHFNPEIASKMLEKKEKLLRLHNPDVAIQNNNNTINVDFSDLSIDEIKQLLNKD